MEVWYRIRHLQSIVCKNLAIPDQDVYSNSIFFALSTTDNDNIGYFYQSSKIDNIFNPFWENLELKYDNIKRFSYLNNFVMTLFLTKKNRNRVFLEIRISIPSLIQIDFQMTNLANDTTQRILFQFKNNWYSFHCDDIKLTYIPDNDNLVKQRMLKDLYNAEAIEKFLYFISDKYYQRVEKIACQRKSLELMISERKMKIVLLCQKENALMALRGHVEQLRQAKETKVHKVSSIKEKSDALRKKIDRVISNDERTSIEIIRHNSNMKKNLDSFVRISNDYMVRMLHLIHELSRIFPITPTDLPILSPAVVNGLDSSGGSSTTVTIRSSDKLSICNLHLPNSEKHILLNQDDTIIAAIGMVFKLLIALSQIYDIPLRYPLIIDGSKLIVRDNIIDIDDNERNFVLTRNTSQSFRLPYAIYLLNLNIAAIRGYFSLSTKYTDRTLWNISTLIEGKSRTSTPKPLIISSSSSLSNLDSKTSLLSKLNRDSPPMSPLAVHSASPLT